MPFSFGIYITSQQERKDFPRVSRGNASVATGNGSCKGKRPAVTSPEVQ